MWKLVDAVDQGWVADQADTGYALILAAEITEREGDLQQAQALAELTALRPLLFEDADAVPHISKALAVGGRAGIAEQWLTDVLVAVLLRLHALDSERSQPAYEQAMAVAYLLAMERHEVRRGLELPHDEHEQDYEEDEYRTRVQRNLVQWSESGCPRLTLLAGTADELAHYADRHGGEPTDPQVRQGYAQHLEEHPGGPPGRRAAMRSVGADRA